MKIVYRNGQKFIITDALYEAGRKANGVGVNSQYPTLFDNDPAFTQQISKAPKKSKKMPQRTSKKVDNAQGQFHFDQPSGETNQTPNTTNTQTNKPKKQGGVKLRTFLVNNNKNYNDYYKKARGNIWNELLQSSYKSQELQNVKDSMGSAHLTLSNEILKMYMNPFCQLWTLIQSSTCEWRQLHHQMTNIQLTRCFYHQIKNGK